MTSRSGYISDVSDGSFRPPPTTQQVQDFINRVAGTAITVVSGGGGGGGYIHQQDVISLGVAEQRYHSSPYQQGLPEVISTTDHTEIRRWGEGPLAGYEVRVRPSEQLTQAQRERFREMDEIAIASQSKPKPVVISKPEPIDFLHPKPRAIEL